IPTAKEAGAASVDSNDATLSFSPIYYPIYTYAPEDKQPFDVGLKSSLQREVSDQWSLQHSRRIHLADERVTRVNFTPQIAEDYAVNIHILDKKSKVSYPDGTEFTYIKAGLRLYPYGSAQSRFNSLQRSARLEDKRQLAKIYDSGIEQVFEGDKAKAEVLYRELGEAGDMESINWLRERASWGYIKDGQYWLERAAKLGDIQAQLELINQPLSVIPMGKVNTGQAKIREQQAWQTLTELTKQGIPQAVSTMAYYQVFSCSPYFDTTAALDNYRKSVKAQPDLARDAAETYYYFKEDLAQAREFFEIAAEREIDVAAEYAGILLAAEQRDPKRARYWLEKVVTAGDKQYIQRDVLGYAYFRLASLLDAGEGGDADPKRAITLYQQSIELGEGVSNDYQAKAKERLQSLQERHL
ncbi:MAG: tetratricopeptide repeat protein, partial [Shewanella sp.]